MLTRPWPPSSARRPRAALARRPTRTPLTCQGRRSRSTGDVGTDGRRRDGGRARPQKASATGAGNDLVCIRRRPTDGRAMLLRWTRAPVTTRCVNERPRAYSASDGHLGAGADTFVGQRRGTERSTPAAATSSDGRRPHRRHREGRHRHAGRRRRRLLRAAVARTPTPTGSHDRRRATTASAWAGDQTGPAVDLGEGDNRLDLYPGWPATVVDRRSRGESPPPRRGRCCAGPASHGLRLPRQPPHVLRRDRSDEYRHRRPVGGQLAATRTPPTRSALDVDMGGGDDRLESSTQSGGLVDGRRRTGSARRPAVRRDRRPARRAFRCRDGDLDGSTFSAAIDAWERVYRLGRPGPRGRDQRC